VFWKSSSDSSDSNTGEITKRLLGNETASFKLSENENDQDEHYLQLVGEIDTTCDNLTKSNDQPTAVWKAVRRCNHLRFECQPC